MDNISTDNTIGTEAKAPATLSTTTPAPAVQQTARDKAPEQITASLPDGYLSKGFYLGEGKGRYVDPALIDQAAEIGKALAESGVKPAAFNRMVKTLKIAARLPYPAQQGALKKLAPQGRTADRQNRKKVNPNAPSRPSYRRPTRLYTR